ncbi:Uncharacterized protein DAT39_021108 [Clarias magur]|uniref:Uncharacterized protein n=1 Tax=Clarias magur TaxID=1594786 RepID=A0A8J4U1S3_CLAMG|nr:Uncharacterized protein DAT39_021108 [Clarias magur]
MSDTRRNSSGFQRRNAFSVQRRSAKVVKESRISPSLPLHVVNVSQRDKFTSRGPTFIFNIKDLRLK